MELFEWDNIIQMEIKIVSTVKRLTKPLFVYFSHMECNA